MVWYDVLGIGLILALVFCAPELCLVYLIAKWEREDEGREE